MSDTVQSNETIKKKIFVIAIKLFVSVALVIYLITKLDFSSLSKLDSNFTLYFLISLSVAFFANAIMALRWEIVLSLIKIKHYSFLLLYNIYLIGAFFNIFIPGAIGGDAMRVYYVCKLYHFSKMDSLLAVFIERVAGLFALGIILMVSLLFNDVIRAKLDFSFGLIAFSTIGIAASLIIAKFSIQKKMPITYRDMSVILLLSGIGQFGDIIVTYIYCIYFDLGIDILKLMSIMPLVYIATVIPISLGGVGVREGVITAGMALYGVNVSDAVVVSFLLYFTKVIMGLFGWGVYLKFNTKLSPNKNII